MVIVIIYQIMAKTIVNTAFLTLCPKADTITQEC